MATSVQFSQLRYFKAAEFEQPESMSYDLLVKLDLARGLAGVPFIINSDVRGDSAEHRIGEAVDLMCVSSRRRFQMVQALMAAGFRRIGVYDRHIHVGIAVERGEAVLWVGVSR